MKKILLGLLAVFVVFSAVQQVGAEDTNIKAIFKIQAYSYDKLSDVYMLEQYGSAVLIAKDILLTNAHVITDMNDKLTLQYEACMTVSDQELPTCFSILKLISYDKDADLALLQIVDPMDNMPTPVTMFSGALNVGANIRIVGYPANGGETITTTQGTIAGFEDGNYKTDANVDEGNSGGGAFDSAGKFVGIPTYVINGQTTMGYIIPASTIKEFIEEESEVSPATRTYSASFEKRITGLYALQEAGIITNTIFTTPDFSKLGLRLDLALEKKNNNLYRYSLYNANDNSIDIISLIATDNATISKYVANSMKQLRESEYSPTKTTKRIGTTTWSVITFGGEDRIGYDYIQMTSSNKTYLEFVILVDKEDIKSDVPKFLQFVENTTIKKSTVKPQPFNFPVIKLSSQRKIGILKYLQAGGLAHNLFANNSKYTVEIYTYEGEKGDTLKSSTTQLKELYEGMGLDVTTETSKYPGSMTITKIVDENKITLSILGSKRSGSQTIFVHLIMRLASESAKQEAINLGYKILSLQ